MNRVGEREGYLPRGPDLGSQETAGCVMKSVPTSGSI